MDIKEIINTEINVLSELNEILDIEKELLIKGEGSKLPEILEKKKTAAHKIAMLETERRKVYGEKKCEEFVSEGVLEASSFEKIKTLTLNAKEKGETNLILTKQSLSYIRVITTALAPAKNTMVYGNNGRIGDNLDRSVFTTKV